MSVGELFAFQEPDLGALFVVSGPSGVGKSTLIHQAIARIPGLSFSVSATTRAARPGEQHGREYHFLTDQEFAHRVKEGAFIEHARVYGRSYGTLRRPTLDALSVGRSLILDIDIQGSRQVRAHLPEAIHVFVMPPSISTLERRLRERATDSEEVIRRRMAEISLQLEACGEFDYLLLNDDLETANTVLQGIFLSEMSRRSRRDSWVRAMRDELHRRSHAEEGKPASRGQSI